MISKVLCEKFPFSSHYFETLLAEKPEKFPQSIVFEGMDIFGEIFFSLELARLLNCEKEGAQECNCLNCNWIREGKHPAVTFVSQADFKPQGDETKTVISVKQAQAVAKSLEQTSQYHRVFIFLDVKSNSLDKRDETIIEEYKETGFALPEDNWKPSALSYKTFHPKAPNALLKSVEEPPKRTTFIFLAKNREDLMQTIVSRSQIFKLPSSRKEIKENDVSTYFKKYPSISLEEAFDISQDLQNYIKETDTTASVVLDTVENSLGDFLKANITNGRLVEMLKQDIRLVNKAKKQINASISPKVVLDSLMIEMSQK